MKPLENSEPETLRVLIVDDEPLARSRLRDLIFDQPGTEVVGEASNGEECIELVKQTRPNVLLLDVLMPKRGGFSVLEQLAESAPPVVIFTTAHAEYGADAFDVNATDYLVKPFDKARLQRALARARRKLRGVGLRSGASSAQWRERFAARLRGRIIFIKAADVIWIQSEGNYVRLHSRDSSCLVRESMKELERTLDPNQFLRVHRTAFVNIDEMTRLETGDDGRVMIVLSNDARAPLGPNYRKQLQEFAGTRI